METRNSLAGDKVTRIDDLEGFRARVAGQLSPFRLRPSSDEQFTSQIWGTALDKLGVVQFSTGTHLDVDIPEHLEYFDFIIARRGKAVVRTGGQEIEVLPGQSGVILQPGAQVEMRLKSGYDQLHLRVSPATLISSAELLFGGAVGSQIRFGEPRINFARTSSTWAATLVGVAEDGYRGVTTAPHSLMARQWAEAIVTSILTTLPNTLAPQFDAGVPRIPYRSLSRATAYIDAHLADSLTVAEVAEAAGVSVRSLQRGFKDHYDASPVAFIEDRRLAAARRDLINASPRESVTDVGYRWGFTHLSRFAAAYARKYGELPSATLKQTDAARAYLKD